jgi:hypothetical protein
VARALPDEPPRYVSDEPASRFFVIGFFFCTPLAGPLKPTRDLVVPVYCASDPQRSTLRCAEAIAGFRISFESVLESGPAYGMQGALELQKPLALLPPCAGRL